MRRSPGRASATLPALVRGERARIGVLLASLALVAAACSGTSTTTSVTHVAQSPDAPDCILGLDLWDTDPALTWIEDGRVWVRAGNSQACLALTDAEEIWWSPDGQRLLLDDELVDAGASTRGPDTSSASQVIWQQPLGSELIVVSHGGDTYSHILATGDVNQVAVPKGTVLLASHPDGDHAATVDRSGRVALVSIDMGDDAELFTLMPGEDPVQIEFSPDGSRLWVLSDVDGTSRARYVDLSSVSESLEVPPPSPLIIATPELLVPPPELRYLTVDLTPDSLDLDVNLGAEGVDATGFALHPTHPDWIVLTEGRCSEASSSLFMDGRLVADGIPGAAVGFFRGRGLPILASTTAGNGCGQGALWVTEGLPVISHGTSVLVSDKVSSVDIRDEAPDPWNPDTAPPFA